MTLTRWFFLILGVLSVVVAIRSCLDPLARVQATTVADAVDQAPPLFLHSYRGEILSIGNILVEGLVENVSTVPMKNVWVVASGYDASGAFISSNDSSIEYDPLLPNQRSPFSVYLRENPKIKTFSVSFKTLFGAELPHRTPNSARPPSP